jgi:hypothetical protein
MARLNSFHCALRPKSARLRRSNGAASLWSPPTFCADAPQSHVKLFTGFYDSACDAAGTPVRELIAATPSTGCADELAILATLMTGFGAPRNRGAQLAPSRV